MNSSTCIRKKYKVEVNLFAHGIAEGEDPERLAKIPIHVSFVQDYGTEGSYLNIESIKKFIAWRPVYKDAIFVCPNGVYENEIFSSTSENKDSHLFTKSEVGKMSKRWYHVINPDEVIQQYGADCFRMYEMFLGPIEQSKPWDIKGIEGVSKFLRKFWNLFHDDAQQISVSDEKATKTELKILHETILKVTKDVEAFSFNTAVSQFMVCANELKKLNLQQNKCT